MVSGTSIGPKEAAELIGRSKSAILKAIKEGRISATKNATGNWHIEPVELFRAYPDCVPSGTQSPRTSAPKVRDVPPSGTQTEMEHLRDLLHRAEKREADLIEERNAWREQAQRLALSDQRPTPEPLPPDNLPQSLEDAQIVELTLSPQPQPGSGFWSRLFGNS